MKVHMGTLSSLLLAIITYRKKVGMCYVMKEELSLEAEEPGLGLEVML
jgi:hypothetical protein